MTAIVLSVVTLGGVPAQAAPGDLDPTFSGDGKLRTSFNPPTSQDLAFDVAVQSNGKIVVAGETIDDKCDVALSRYTTGGNLDSTFGGDGKVTTYFGMFNLLDDRAFAIAIQPSDGRIVVAGSVGSSSGSEFAAAGLKTEDGRHLVRRGGRPGGDQVRRLRRRQRGGHPGQRSHRGGRVIGR